jgi:hypothetical protein
MINESIEMTYGVVIAEKKLMKKLDDLLIGHGHTILVIT